MLENGSRNGQAAEGDSGNTSCRIESSVLGPLVILFALGFAVPFLTAVVAILVDGRLHHIVFPPWIWGLFGGLSVFFGMLAAVGFTYDIARRIEVQSDGIKIGFGSGSQFYPWREIHPDAAVFPDQIRFRSCTGLPFFIRPAALRILMEQPLVPKWELPIAVKDKLDRRLS